MNKKIPKLNISIRNESDDVAVIDIDGTIGWVNENGDWNTATAIKEKLKQIDQVEASKIIVNINSLGGFVDDGLAIHDVLASHSAEIETRVIGMTASAATVIAQAGDTRFMSDNSLYLIHKAWGLAMGNANDMMESAADLETIDKRLLNIYVKRSGKNEDELRGLMDENSGGGKWIDADEALEFGLIDEAFEPMKAAASVDVQALRNSGLPIPEQYKQEDSKGVTFPVNIRLHVNGEPYDGTIEELTKNVTKISQESDSNESAEGIPSEGIDLQAEAREREAEILII